jgi:hypothetical protein
MAHIRHSISIAAPAERIQPLFASGQGFAQWWAEDVTENSNGTVELGFFNRATAYRLAPVRTKGLSLAEWQCETGQEWSGTRLIFELAPQGSSTLLRFTHADWKAETDYFVSCTTVWGELMFRLKATAEGKAPGPLFKTNAMAY